MPFDNRKRTPVIQSISPVSFIQPIFSFKKIRAKMIDMIGEEVVPIKARLIAEV